jgi:hypothetical protein
MIRSSNLVRGDEAKTCSIAARLLLGFASACVNDRHGRRAATAGSGRERNDFFDTSGTKNRTLRPPTALAAPDLKQTLAVRPSVDRKDARGLFDPSPRALVERCQHAQKIRISHGRAEERPAQRLMLPREECRLLCLIQVATSGALEGRQIELSLLL